MSRNSRKKRRKNSKTIRNYIISLILLILILFLMVSCVRHVFGRTGGGDASVDGKDGGAAEQAPVEFSVMCVGDVMAHSINIEAARTDDGYDFSDNYEYVTDYIQKADLALCNMETTFGGGTPSGYPMFNAPDELATAVKDAGFDVAITSNNHMMDTGTDGMQRTLQVLREAGLETVGSHLEGETDTWLVTEVNGVKVGVVAYTYETTQEAGGAPTINGNSVSETAAGLINSFNYADLESEDYDRIQADMDACREAGAALVICYMHWGEEYETSPNSRQTAMAQELAERGADIIFASHPHVLQAAEVLTASSGKNVPVFYSLGNYISNQRDETLSNRLTENGAMAYVNVVYDPNSEEVDVHAASVVPTWVDKYQDSTKEYRIIPLDADLDANPTLEVSGHLSRAKRALEDAVEMFGPLLDGADIEDLAAGSTGAEGESLSADEEDGTSNSSSGSSKKSSSGQKGSSTTEDDESEDE